jgi:hypothetical protein
VEGPGHLRVDASPLRYDRLWQPFNPKIWSAHLNAAQGILKGKPMKVILRFESIALASKATSHVLMNEPVVSVGIYANQKNDDGSYGGSCMGWAECYEKDSNRVKAIMIGMGGQPE